MDALNKAMASQQDRRFAYQLKLAVLSGDVQMARRLIKGRVDTNATIWVSKNLSNFAQR